jgi:molybdate transport system substrate-binding protein
MYQRLGLLLSLLLVSCTAASKTPVASPQITLTVAAAASLTDAFKAMKTSYEAQHLNVTVKFSFAASGVLQKQIEEGAPIDVFASAGKKQMDALERQNLLVLQTKKTFAQNQLVVVAIASQTPWLTKFSDLGDRRLQRLAIGNPTTVPAGEYAKAALEAANLYTPLQQQQKLVLGENVRQVLAYVEQGNVDAAIVYATDAATSQKVQVAIPIPADASLPIRYPIAVIKQSHSPQQAQDFINFVTSSQGQQILQKYGFVPLVTHQ